MARYCFNFSYRPGTLASRPDALSRREQDMPEGQQDDRLQHRYKQLLESPPAIVNAMDTSPNEEDSPTEQDNDDDDSPELDAPFVDPDLQALWTTAIK